MIPNLSVSISGEPKSGKSHFALTFPDPIAVFSFDWHGAELLVHKFPDKQIDVYKFVAPLALTADSTQESLDLWKKLGKEYREAVESGKYKTIILDPATIAWDIVKNGFEFERQKGRLFARDYGIPNTRMLNLLVSPIVSGMNFVSVNYVKDIWVDDKNTGQKDIDGFKHTDGIVDIIVFTEMKEEKGKHVVKSKIIANRFDRDLNGFEMVDATYNDLMGILGVEV